MKGQTMGRIGSAKAITTNISHADSSIYEHVGLENLTYRKIFHKNRRFSTAC